MTKTKKPKDYAAIWEDIHNNYMTSGGKNFATWAKEFKGKTEKDLLEWFNDFDRKRSMSPDFRREMVAQAKRKGIIQKDLMAEAARTHFQRSTKARLQDERVTAKDLRKLNKENFRQWRKNPGKFDIKGVDDAQRRKMGNYLSMKIRSYSDKKVRRQDGEPQYYNEKTKRWHSILTGNFRKT